jgi:hypothetical protein
MPAFGPQSLNFETLCSVNEKLYCISHGSDGTQEVNIVPNLVAVSLTTSAIRFAGL